MLVVQYSILMVTSCAWKRSQAIHWIETAVLKRKARRSVLVRRNRLQVWRHAAKALGRPRLGHHPGAVDNPRKTATGQLKDIQTHLSCGSCRVVDTLPKHWGGRGSAAIPEQLTAKANSHLVLLDTLQRAGALDQMPPSALRWAPLKP